MDGWPPLNHNLREIGFICVGTPDQIVQEDRPAVLWPFVYPTKLSPPLTWTFGNYILCILNELLPSDQNLRGNELICPGTSLQVVPEGRSAVPWPFVHSTKLSLTLTSTFH